MLDSFQLCITPSDIRAPRMWLEKDSYGKYAEMLNFYPDLSWNSERDIPEVIFVADCSASMQVCTILI